MLSQEIEKDLSFHNYLYGNYFKGLLDETLVALYLSVTEKLEIRNFIGIYVA